VQEPVPGLADGRRIRIVRTAEVEADVATRHGHEGPVDGDAIWGSSEVARIEIEPSSPAGSGRRVLSEDEGSVYGEHDGPAEIQDQAGCNDGSSRNSGVRASSAHRSKIPVPKAVAHADAGDSSSLGDQRTNEKANSSEHDEYRHRCKVSHSHVSSPFGSLAFHNFPC